MINNDRNLTLDTYQLDYKQRNFLHEMRILNDIQTDELIIFEEHLIRKYDPQRMPAHQIMVE